MSKSFHSNPSLSIVHRRLPWVRGTPRWRGSGARRGDGYATDFAVNWPQPSLLFRSLGISPA